MKVAIVGSRDYPDLDEVRRYVREQLADDDVVVSGGARGVDRAAESEARRRGLQVLIFPAEWDKYGKSAGMRRNAQLVDTCEMLIAWWDGTSRGTANSVDRALRAGKPVRVFQPGVGWADFQARKGQP